MCKYTKLSRGFYIIRDSFNNLEQSKIYHLENEEACMFLLDSKKTPILKSVSVVSQIENTNNFTMSNGINLTPNNTMIMVCELSIDETLTNRYFAKYSDLLLGEGNNIFTSFLKN